MLKFYQGIKPRTNQLVKYFAFIIAAFVFILLFSVLNDATFTFNRFLYVFIAVAIMAAPYLFASSKSGKYLLLSIFLPLYFFMFFINDLFLLLGLSDNVVMNLDYKSAVDKVIILGGISYIFGYIIVSKVSPKYWKGIFHREWNLKNLKSIGLFFWVLGTACFAIIWFEVDSPLIPESSLSLISNMKKFSIIGIVMLIYLYMNKKSKFVLSVIIGICIFEFILGFVANTKEVSFRTPLIFILMQFMLIGKINVKLLIVVFISLVAFTSVFNIYRYQVIQLRDQTPKEVIAELPAAAEIIIKNLGRRSNKDINSRSADFVRERLDARKYVEIIVEGTSKNVPFAQGETIDLFWKSFIPRYFWPEKPNIAIGQVFNWTFHISQSRLTYVPPTHLGELYWNYGYYGVGIGMLLIGMLMALICSSVNLSNKITLPRVIFLMMTIYTLCVRFEVGIALSYSNMFRAFMIMLILNWILVRKTR